MLNISVLRCQRYPCSRMSTSQFGATVLSKNTSNMKRPLDDSTEPAGEKKVWRKYQSRPNPKDPKNPRKRRCLEPECGREFRSWSGLQDHRLKIDEGVKPGDRIRDPQHARKFLYPCPERRCHKTLNSWTLRHNHQSNVHAEEATRNLPKVEVGRHPSSCLFPV